MSTTNGQKGNNMEDKKIIRLFECRITTNEGVLPIYIKTDDPALNKAKEQAKEQAKEIYVSHLLTDSKFSYAYLDKIDLVIEEEEKDD